MKTKKLFLMAAMLLMSVCTFAQNNTSLKGDVNEDGTVDVADLVSIMKIMKDAGGAVGEKMYYWYAGVNGGNAVTETNFTDIASKIAESQIPQTGFVTAADQYVYFVMPERRHITSLTNANGAAVEYDCVDAFGYHIYKTSERVNGTFNYATAETIYYWYVGTSKPTSLSQATVVNSYPAEQSFTNPSTTEKCYVYVLTNANKIVNFYDPADSTDALLKAEDTTTINGYKITYISADGSTPFKIAKGGSIIIRIS